MHANNFSNNFSLGSRDGAVVRALVSHNVARVRFPESVSNGAPRGFSPGTSVFPRVLRFSPLLKNQKQKHFQIFISNNDISNISPIRSGAVSPYCKAHLIISSWNYAVSNLRIFNLIYKFCAGPPS